MLFLSTFPCMNKIKDFKKNYLFPEKKHFYSVEVNNPKTSTFPSWTEYFDTTFHFFCNKTCKSILQKVGNELCDVLEPHIFVLY